MNWPEIQRDGQDRQPGKRAVQLQGPRPSPLSVNKASRKIGKPPLPAHPNHPYPYPPPRAPAHNREPVIIYAVSPKVIHAEASDFMSVVQRLTGLCPPSPPCWERGAAWETIQNHPTSNNFPSPPGGGPISPAARMAVLERASPQDRERAPSTGLVGIMDWDSGGIDLGPLPGILSPAPANLPAVGTEMFSQAVDPQGLFGFEDGLLSPWGAASLNYFASPGSSALFPGGGGLFSSAPSPVLDISKLFDY